MWSYDRALRGRVIAAVEAGASARSAAARFDIGVATAIRWVRRWRQDGTLEDAPRRAKGSVLDVHGDWLDALRQVEPELSCQAVADRLAREHGLRVHETTVWYWLRRRGVTHKKSR